MNFQCHLSKIIQSIFLDGPFNFLKEKIENKELEPDKHQQDVVIELQKIYEQVKSYQPPPQKGNLTKWFSFGKSKEEVSSAPKGLYIYGSVGGGKTMLMDLFYESCKVNKTKFAKSAERKMLSLFIKFIFKLLFQFSRSRKNAVFILIHS